jgi:hypothetical protein
MDAKRISRQNILDGKNYVILSEVGKNENGEYYYYQNVFEEALAEIIEKTRDLDARTPVLDADAGNPNLYNNKYSKIFEIMQGFSEKIF